MPGQMFLRTALTEQRIEDLEKQMARVMDHLGLNNAEPPPKEASDPDSEWEAAAPKGYDGEPGAGEDAPLPLPVGEHRESRPQSKIAQKVAKGRR